MCESLSRSVALYNSCEARPHTCKQPQYTSLETLDHLSWMLAEGPSRAQPNLWILRIEWPSTEKSAALTSTYLVCPAVWMLATDLSQINLKKWGKNLANYVNSFIEYQDRSVSSVTYVQWDCEMNWHFSLDNFPLLFSEYYMFDPNVDELLNMISLYQSWLSEGQLSYQLAGSRWCSSFG